MSVELIKAAIASITHHLSILEKDPVNKASYFAVVRTLLCLRSMHSRLAISLPDSKDEMDALEYWLKNLKPIEDIDKYVLKCGIDPDSENHFKD